MVISDGAILPLSGIIDNTGTIELNSTSNETDLELIEHGITLQGQGQVILSDSAENVIAGTVSDVTLTNVDNTISGAGHLGDGVMVLVNEGTIIATGTNALDIDTGTNVVTQLRDARGNRNRWTRGPQRPHQHRRVGGPMAATSRLTAMSAATERLRLAVLPRLSLRARRLKNNRLCLRIYRNSGARPRVRFFRHRIRYGGRQSSGPSGFQPRQRDAELHGHANGTRRDLECHRRSPIPPILLS